MIYRYNRSYQIVYFVGGLIILVFGLVVCYLGFETLNSFSNIPANTARGMNRTAGRGLGFAVLLLLGGLSIAAYSRKPFGMLASSLRAKVELSQEGIVFSGIDKACSCSWADIKRANEDDFTGLEIKHGSEIMIIPKRYENWEHLVKNVLTNTKRTSAKN